MSRRVLLTAGILAIAAALAAGLLAFATSGSISIDKAQQSVQAVLDQSRNPDLEIDELMEFQENFYALVKEKSTGIGAFELLVDKRSGSAAPEPGPNMMWNTKYGMMGGGMMGYRPISTSMTVTTDQATRIAQSWLDARLAGDSAGTPDAFYGYYTFHFEKGGRIAGMLSINGYTGQVWFHSWHGAFVQSRDFGS